MSFSRQANRETPCDQSIEEAVLGAILMDAPKVLPLARLTFKLTAEVFFQPGTRLVWQAIIALDDEQRPVDVVSVSDELKRANQLEHVGGALYLDGILERAITPAHAEYHLSRLIELYDKRRVIHVGQVIEKDGYDAAQENGKEVAARGITALFEIVEAAQKAPSNAEAMTGVIDTWKKLKKYRDTGSAIPMIGKAYGLPRLEDTTDGLQPLLYVLAAEQSTGKTTLEGQICGLFCSQDWPCLRITMDSRREDLFMRDLARESGVSLAKLNKGFLQPHDQQKVEDARAIMADWPVEIETDLYLINDICTRIRAAAAKRKKTDQPLALATIDFLQMVRTGDRGLDRDRVGRTEEIARILKGLVKEIGIPILALSQLSREDDAVKRFAVNWIERRPHIDRLKDSSSIQQVADLVLLLSHVKDLEEGQSGNVSIVAADVCKNRNGPKNIVFLKFHREYFRMEELDRSAQKEMVRDLEDEIDEKRYSKKKKQREF
jgi:replicative DNA helicase